MFSFQHVPDDIVKEVCSYTKVMQVYFVIFLIYFSAWP